MTSIFDNITVSGSGALSGAPATAGGLSAASGSTGLLAAVSAEEFERLVRDAVDPVVLRSNAKLTQPASNRQGGLAGTALNGFRYVFPCAGIIFVTTTGTRLSLGANVREVSCLAIVHEGKPLGRDDGAL